ncbi:MAG: YfiR family protein [Gammaproteobacteria bacterium]|nr:YfiR family protein [Gammaproteobacteria bacterium]
MYPTGSVWSRLGPGWALSLWLGLGLVAPALAAPPGASEEAVKAAYVYNFTKFTEWPDSAFTADDALVICTDAEGELATAMHSLHGRKAVGRSVQVRKLPEQGLEGCQVALLDSRDNAERCDTGLPVLTITTFNQPGAVMRLFIQGSKLRFAIDLGAARRGSIKLSSKLLSVAAEVVDTD